MTDRAQESRYPPGTVEGDDEDPLLPSDTQLRERPGRTAGKLEELTVGDVATGGVDRHLTFAAGLQGALEKVRADVVAIGKIQPSHLHLQCSFEVWRVVGWCSCWAAGGRFVFRLL